MRKYLLLATTAMLFAGNAMAGTVAPDGQSATVEVSAELVRAKTIESATDMSFGKLIVSSWNGFGEEATKIATLSNNNVTINDTAHIVTTGGTPTSSIITMTDGAESTFNITCDEGSIEGDGCTLVGSSGSSLYVKDFSTVATETAGEYRIDANLYAHAYPYETGYSTGTFTGAIVVSIAY